MKIKFSIWFWLFIALAMRLFKIQLVKCIATDGVAYISVARDWLAGTGFNPNWPPLYPWFISHLLRIGIGSELSGQFVSAVFGAATVYIVYIMTRAVFSPRIARISTIFCVFHPYLVRYSGEVLSDSLFTFLLTAVIFCGWLLIRHKKLRFALLTGFLAGLAYLTKPEGILLLVIISLWHRRPWHVLCMWVVFFALAFPYMYSIREQKGRWMISEKQNIVFSVALQEEGLADEFLGVSPWRYAIENPGKFFLKIGKGALKLVQRIPEAYHPLLFLFLIVGLASGIKEKRFLHYILTFLIPYFIGYAIFHPGRRYLVGWVPVTLFLSAYGIEKMNRWAVTAILVTILVMLPKALSPIREEGAIWKEVGTWIKSNPRSRTGIIDEDIRIGFYAGE